MTTPAALTEISRLGVSIWLDDLDRNRIQSGDLARLIDERCVVGVTTNPSIFEKAISTGAAAYASDLESLAATGTGVDAAIRRLTTDDVRAACDVMQPVWEATRHVDGRVSIEVDPRLANDTAATIAQAAELWATVDRPNALIKIPATKAGLPAITATIAAGISVNVTLIFAVDRYVEVIAAYEEGLRQAAAAGLNLSTIHSVASFFVSRVDSEVDARLSAITTATADAADTTEITRGHSARALRGQAAIANARLAWVAFEQALATGEWRELAAKGAHPQRPLWASTGVKDPAYNDTRYVVDLAVAGCVNTMPEPTLEAVGDHGVILGDTVTGTGEASADVWTALSALGINESDVCDKLETEGVQKFIDAWEQLRATVTRAMAQP